MKKYLYEFDIKDEDREDAAAEGGLDYVSETELTASNVFTPDQVGVGEFRRALLDFVRASQELDKFKKALFRKRNRQESGLSVGANGEYPFQYGDSLGFLIQGAGHDDLFHGIVGVATESGEQVEILIKLMDGERVDVTNVREEIGDVLWYLARLVKWAGTSFLTEMVRNITKLRARHGTAGFNKDRDINRDLEAEHKLLEGE